MSSSLKMNVNGLGYDQIHGLSINFTSAYQTENLRGQLKATARVALVMVSSYGDAYRSFPLTGLETGLRYYKKCLSFVRQLNKKHLL